MTHNSEESTIDHLLADYFGRMDRGEPIDAEAFIKAHPTHANQLREYFENEGLFKAAECAQTHTFAQRDTPAQLLRIRCPLSRAFLAQFL